MFSLLFRLKCNELCGERRPLTHGTAANKATGARVSSGRRVPTAWQRSNKTVPHGASALQAPVHIGQCPWGSDTSFNYHSKSPTREQLIETPNESSREGAAKPRARTHTCPPTATACATREGGRSACLCSEPDSLPQVCDFPPREKARLGAQQHLSHMAAVGFPVGTAHDSLFLNRPLGRWGRQSPLPE